jgi:hypothetical protein
MKTSELTGAALDWAVAICEHNVGWEPEGEDRDFYSTNWAQGGPIIEREKLNLWWCKGNQFYTSTHQDGTTVEDGPTPLIAAMRCYVASKLGDEVEIPEELL